MTTAERPGSPGGGSPPPDPVTTVELEVTGMHCASCVALVEETLAEQRGVTRAAVDLPSGGARVDFDPSAVTVDELCAAVAGAGYAAAPRQGPGSPC
jgi:Cu+-exporting ATPase